ncbi:MAG TPA: hypothetical protein VGN82_20490 [Bosea sp. (in: a-proteobacteria)]|uniref:hypothetical protein n=1 Tax=Bosea sp. (in: a-proteobacteria) TaxID=1871050 RepID=UPI002E109471|nr:hypothetical protein [Bosea sp. (in: a-proteobacteria)]
MARATAWDEDTAPSQIAEFLPRKPYERWLDLGFGLVVAALLGGWLLLPQPANEARPAAPQVTLR